MTSSNICNCFMKNTVKWQTVPIKRTSELINVVDAMFACGKCVIKVDNVFKRFFFVLQFVDEPVNRAFYYCKIAKQLKLKRSNRKEFALLVHHDCAVHILYVMKIGSLQNDGHKRSKIMFDELNRMHTTHTKKKHNVIATLHSVGSFGSGIYGTRILWYVHMHIEFGLHYRRIFDVWYLMPSDRKLHTNRPKEMSSTYLFFCCVRPFRIFAIGFAKCSERKTKILLNNQKHKISPQPKS